MSPEANILLTTEQVKALRQYAEGMSAINGGLNLQLKQLHNMKILWPERAMHPAAESQFSAFQTKACGEAAVMARLCETLENNHGITIVNVSVPCRGAPSESSAHQPFFMRGETIETVLGVLYGWRKVNENEELILQPQGRSLLERSRSAVLTFITDSN